MTTAAVQKEIDRQLAVMRDGAVDFFGEAELRERLAGGEVEVIEPPKTDN